MKAHHVIRHTIDYLLLVVIVVLGFGGLFFFHFDLASQIADVIITSILYVFWGIYHHFHDGNLTGKITLEYTSIACLVAFVLIIFLLRA